MTDPDIENNRRERAHWDAVELAWSTGRAELALMRGIPEHAERVALLLDFLRATEAYLAARWVRP